MSRPFDHTTATRYWLNVFALYALVEAIIQLLFFFILNNFGTRPISHIEFHGLMWIFQCLLIWPVWWVALLVQKEKIVIQVFVNVSFYLLYSYVWFGPVQELIGYLYTNLEEITRAPEDRLEAMLDNGSQYSYLNYQLLKHAFRLSWFYLAAYFYNYREEEKRRIELALANKDLQLKMLKWHLNPSFYFKTINHLQQVAAVKPQQATEPILQLAKVMEYVIYEARESLIEMKKETAFLHIYACLLSRQSDAEVLIRLECEPGGEQLKIAPLLLAGLLDNVISAGKKQEKEVYSIRIAFEGNRMKFSITGTEQAPDLPALLENLYPSKYTTTHTDAGIFTLNLQLDAS
ncbi:MAG: histidine kinase [Chitinophagales bacterium]|nr:histidine kinase [Chitinophagales bacterium]